jgi:hypothetical protein
LVARSPFLYRIGGMAARNLPGQPDDLVSLSLVQRIGPPFKSWLPLPSLPEPRSSHDAALVGHHLFVAGGWHLSGGSNAPVWLNYALSLDLDQPQPAWEPIPQPFQRRALAVAALSRRAFCLGGMDAEHRTSLAVDVYDLNSGQWTQGPDLPTGRHRGFGCAATSHQGHLYASLFQGDLLRLNETENRWELVGRLQPPRIAHRLVAGSDGYLIALGGEDGELKRPDLEILPLKAKHQAANAAERNPIRAVLRPNDTL